ncbi:MAG: sensor histidine kinase [Candidatus Binataceae bacterium]
MDDLSHSDAIGGDRARRAAPLGATAQDLDTLANLAHELRTPAQVLLGYLEILTEDLATDLTSRTRPLIARMQTHAYDLALAIENVLDFARVHPGAEPTDNEDLNLDDLSAELMPALEVANSEKRLELVIDFDRSCGSIRIRPRALRAILLNLALNAIKFTDSGSVRISAQRRIGPAGGDKIEFDVKDTGPGIGAAQLEHIFQPWTQLSSSTTRRHRGLGLGLAVVKRNVDAVGGELTVESSLGVGSRFVVSIPCEPASAMVAPPVRQAGIFRESPTHARGRLPKTAARMHPPPRVPRSRV